MSDFGPLFDRHPPAEPSLEGDTADSTYGVLALNQAITAALESTFPGEVWVRGELQGIARTRMRRHWYFELVEKDPQSDQVLAKVSVALLSWNRSAVEREMRVAPGFELEDDLEVRIRCEVGYYAPFGKLQLVMKGVDPSFTLGQMAVNRERILRRLAQLGLLEKNAARELPPVPARIGLVTSLGSAAYNDFVHEIERSDLGLHILACDARVQGAQTESTVTAALRTLQAKRCDLLVLIRGGGSRSDLAGFDTESIARTIAQARVPVWTGIGHEIDHSVADVVAHRSFKTPTAVATAIVERVEGFLEEIEGRWEAIASGATEKLQNEHRQLNDVVRQLARETLHSRERATVRLQRRSREVVHAVRMRIAVVEGRLRVKTASLSPARFARSLDRRTERLMSARQRVIHLATRSLRDAAHRVDASHKRVVANDPARLLERGYALTYDETGRLVRDASTVEVGASLRTRLARGELLTRIEQRFPARGRSEQSNHSKGEE